MIQKATICDVPVLAELAGLLWEGHSREELKAEFEEMLLSQETGNVRNIGNIGETENAEPVEYAKNAEKAAFFLLMIDGKAAGFAQCQLRYDYVEGTESSPVGYLEGIFVREEYRKKGYGRALIQECETWSAGKGCTEFASDCELTNETSRLFHLGAGFEEANRIICFTKKLSESNTPQQADEV